MRIGYPCLNLGVGCTSSRTFRLASYSRRRMEETVTANLDCLGATLRFNREHGIRFFRITSDLVPFASHPVCDFPWRERFAGELASIGRFLAEQGMRVSAHPDQFVVINSPDEGVFRRSLAELTYHADLLDLMGTGPEAKIQIHVGGAYGDREAGLERFAARWRLLPRAVRRRLAVENDESRFSVADCLVLHRETGIPLVFDSFHHRVLPGGMVFRSAVEGALATWVPADGPAIVHYSSQAPGRRPGTHADTLDEEDFARFLELTRGLDFDLMLEIKDKEKSALRAMELARRLGRGS